jgi:hypothetical protein
MKLSVTSNAEPVSFRGGLTMALYRHTKKPKKKVPMPEFSYTPNEALAQMIVDAWVDDDYRKGLLEREKDKITVTAAAAQLAKASLAEKGFYLNRVVVITEEEYDNDYIAQAAGEIVLVLPDQDRVTPRPGQNLIETARFLMAATPNGI